MTSEYTKQRKLFILLHEGGEKNKESEVGQLTTLSITREAVAWPAAFQLLVSDSDNGSNTVYVVKPRFYLLEKKYRDNIFHQLCI